MLQLMRKHAQSWLIKTAVFIIGIVFVFWEAGTYRSRRAMRLAEVNGDLILVDEFNRAYDEVLRSVQERFKGNISDELMKSLHLRQQAFNRLVERKVLLQIAKGMKIKVGPKAIQAAILSYPAFLDEKGRFDARRYRMILDRLHLSPAEFEQTIKDDLTIGQLRGIVTSTVLVSKKEIEELHQFIDQEIKVEWLGIEPSRIVKDIPKPSEEEITKYYDKHKQEFKTEPRVKLAYIRFKLEDYIPKVKLSEEEIKDYYEFHKDEFKRPERIHARHILIKWTKDNPKEKEAAYKKAKEILDRLKAGEDFAKLAKQYSDDIGTKDKGGDLGFFTKGKMVPAFEKAAFSLKPGDISNIIETRFGYHIIKVEAKEPEKIFSLSEVRNKIVEKLNRRYAKDMAYEEANNIYDQIMGFQDIVKFGSHSGKKVEETEFFSKSSPPEDLSRNPKIIKMAFELKKGDISPVMELGDGYLIFQILDAKKSTIKPLKEVRDIIQKRLFTQKRKEKAFKKANNWLTAIKEGKLSMEAIAKNEGVEYKKTPFFSRMKPIPDIGFAPDISDKIFYLWKGQPYPDKVLEWGNKLYIFHFLARKVPPLKEDRKKLLRDSLLAQKRAMFFRDWIKERIDNADIKLFRPLE